MTDILTKTYESIQHRARHQYFILANTPRGKFPKGAGVLIETVGNSPEEVASYQLMQRGFCSSPFDPKNEIMSLHASEDLADNTTDALHSLIERQVMKVVPEVNMDDSLIHFSESVNKVLESFLRDQGKPKNGFIVIVCNVDFTLELNPSRDIPVELQDKWDQAGFSPMPIRSFFLAGDVHVVPVVNPMSPRYNSNDEREEFYKQVPAPSGEGEHLVVNEGYLNAPTGSFLIWSPDILTWQCPDEDTRFGSLSLRDGRIYNVIQAVLQIGDPCAGRLVKYKRNLTTPPIPNPDQ